MAPNGGDSSDTRYRWGGLGAVQHAGLMQIAAERLPTDQVGAGVDGGRDAWLGNDGQTKQLIGPKEHQRNCNPAGGTSTVTTAGGLVALPTRFCTTPV